MEEICKIMRQNDERSSVQEREKNGSQNVGKENERDEGKLKNIKQFLQYYINPRSGRIDPFV